MADKNMFLVTAGWRKGQIGEKVSHYSAKKYTWYVMRFPNEDMLAHIQIEHVVRAPKPAEVVEEPKV
jgi:hypothetical protein